MEKDLYTSPLSTRYAGKNMSHIFSDFFKYSTWRKLWTALADTQRVLGLDISSKQIQQLTENIENINYEAAEAYEKKFRHDVMAHLYAYGDQCPEAKPIIHLGATSCFLTDNGDLIQIKEALGLIRAKLIGVIRHFVLFAKRYSDMPCLAYTHLQPAQPTTVGKRACLWLQDFLMDLIDLNDRIEKIPFLGAKGTTGTQASFLTLFNGDHEKVRSLDKLLTKKMGFTHLLTISGQTYTRKIDVQVLNLLGAIATSASKFATDFRLLSHMKELQEPFETNQVGSSAMPYKMNPIRSERICSLARYMLSLQENPKHTAANQWLERTLDDSANRRLTIAEAFLTTDSILNLLLHLTQNIEINKPIIEANLEEELPFLATESIMMILAKKGGDRQDLHERLRNHCRHAIDKMRRTGEPNDLMTRISNDPFLRLSSSDVEEATNPQSFIGRSNLQVEEFIKFEVRPILEKYEHIRVPLEEVPV